MKIRIAGIVAGLLLMFGVSTGVAAEADLWKFLWAQEGNGDQIHYRPESVHLLETNQLGVIYRAELISFWSIPMRNKIAEEMNLPGEVKEKFFRSEAGIAYEVEMDMSRWQYRIQRVGYVADRKSEKVTWTGAGRGEWRSLMGNEMGEPLATLAIRIYQDRGAIQKRPKQSIDLTTLPKIQKSLELPWIEFDQTSWGRYFFLPSELKVISSSEKGSEQFQVLVRSDWTLRARKEAPEAENAVRISEKRKPIEGLNQTDQDYMIWSFDFSDQKRSYLAGAYLTEDKKVIHQEGAFAEAGWSPWETPMNPGAIAAYLLANPQFIPTKGAEDGKVEVPQVWSGKK